MRKFLWIPVLVVMGWSAYWLWAAQALESAITGWLADRQAEGWQADTAEIVVTGYPLRLDTTLTDIALADPETGLAWRAPGLEIRQTAWQPNALTLIWPDSHELGTPQTTITLRNDALVADLVTAPAPALPLETAALRASTMTLTETDGATTSLAGFSAEITRSADTTYTAQILAEGVVLSAPVLARLTEDLPESLDRAQLDLVATFDRPWDLRALDDARPQPRALDLRLLEAHWGPMALRVSADLEIDADGVPEGTVSVQAQNWRDMLAIAEQTGILPAALAGTVADGLAMLAGLSGNPASLDLDLRLDNGQAFVGFLPLGRAPRLQLR